MSLTKEPKVPPFPAHAHFSLENTVRALSWVNTGRE
jgi:hypothetical protein